MKSRRSATRATARGMTLIEIMMVVTLVGILAALALVGYGRWVRSSKMSEAVYMVNAIRTAEEHYRSDQLAYLDVSSTLDSSYPNATPNKSKVAWGGPCTNCKAGATWTHLGIDSAPVQFGYAVVAGNDACDTACRGVTLPTGIPVTAFQKTDWYVVKARGDTDANGVFCEVYAFSGKPDLLVFNEGELRAGERPGASAFGRAQNF